MAQSKLIVITGCTRGLGRALVDEFLAGGHTVVGCGRNAEAVMDLRFAHAAPHSFDVVDVANAVRVALWAERILASCGVPDLLINNAGLMNTPAALWKVPAEEFERLIDINVTGVANVIRAFVPAMVERGTGIIVNLSSGWGRSVSAEVAPYCASKWAIEGMTKAMAEELPAGMAAVPLNPGVIDTDMLRKCWGEGATTYPKAAAWAKVAAPFLLALDARANGQSLSVPGVPLD
jgi:NAD(P)-dependent dehydrogenase (short-subunit alcohol dehydrogenase family)